MKQVLFSIIAVSGLMVSGAISAAHGAITETTTITYVFDFPDSKPQTTKNVVTATNCTSRSNGDRGGNGGGGSYRDTNGDGFNDTRTSDPRGTHDSYGGHTGSYGGMSGSNTGGTGLW